jgi:hypothetical protein
VNDTTTDTAVTAEAPQVGTKFKFFFKTPILKDDEGNEIGKGVRPPTVVAVIPTPTKDDITAYLQHHNETVDGKKTVSARVADAIMEAVEGLIFDGAKNFIADWQEKNPGKNFTATDFDLDKLTLEYLATLPRGTRGAWAPSDEELKSFNEDYAAVMIGQINYEPKKVKTHCDIFAKGLLRVKADKAALAKIKDLLTVYASTKDEESLAEYSAVYGWLMAKADKYLAADERDYSQAL